MQVNYDCPLKISSRGKAILVTTSLQRALKLIIKYAKQFEQEHEKIYEISNTD